jgi:glucose dehydrogenase
MYCSNIKGSASRFLNYKEVRAAVRRIRARRNWSLIAVGAALSLGIALYFGAARTSAQHGHSNEHDRPNHGKDLANTRFQNLDQINPRNVGSLQVAWVFHTGVLDPLAESSRFHTTSLPTT